MNANKYNYTVENSILHVILPISYSYAGSYVAVMTDGGDLCVTYGISIISRNKFKVYNKDMYNIENVEGWHGHIITIGF